MKRTLLAAAFLCAGSSVAAGEKFEGPGIGSGPSTTASVHCDALAAPQREACMRALRERDKTGSSNPAARNRTTKESPRAPVKAAPVESRTPEEAAARAADPKAPSGAIIIDTPGGKLPRP